MFGFAEVWKAYAVEKEKRKLLELKRKIDLEKRNHEIAVKSLELEMKFVEQGKMKPEDNLDYLAMKQMDKSYKDEAVMFVLFTPIGLAFVPSLQQHVKAGFELLQLMPDWYMYLVSGIVVTVYGLRSIVRLFFTSKTKDILPK